MASNEETDCPVVQESMDDQESLHPKDRLLALLDRVEAEVEYLRSETMRLEERKDSVFTALDSLRNSDLLRELHETDRDDIEKYMERVSTRCLTIEILVRTVRSSQQEEALHQVNRLIDSLVVSFKSDPSTTKAKCQSYIASCSEQPEVPGDKVFENVLLGCTIDDQKKVKKRLQGLYNYLDSDGKFSALQVD
ncbi:BAG family molecular chaperone regulator 2 [Cimex lectularius]|uniref:BAG family molecular chaperone regulator 2 n=1 Tax=Cimex lectularius TaxID=79782 RepID=A0A8I6RMZ5_CIMLE|nr:BAG family molecular chaperone regulator 2 [Cimex lectularius]